jgi:hypothetical protein
MSLEQHLLVLVAVSLTQCLMRCRRTTSSLLPSPPLLLTALLSCSLASLPLRAVLLLPVEPESSLLRSVAAALLVVLAEACSD